MTSLPTYLAKEPLLPTVWSEVGLNEFFVAIHKYGRVHTSFNVTNDELNQFHPQLANAVRALIKSNGRTLDAGRTTAHDVVVTLDLLCERHIEVTDDRQTPRLMVDITGINKKNGMYEITGTLVDVEMFEVDGVQYPYAAGIYFATFVTNGVELEFRYPGWETRYAMCQSLSMGWPEMMSYIFTPNQAQEAELPIIGMD